MRTGSGAIARAFLNGQSRRIKNDRTDGRTWYYHGHAIAWHEGGGVVVTLAGYPTVTTRLRLNTLAELRGKGRPFSQRNFDQFFGYSAANDHARQCGWPQPEVEIGSREIIAL